MSQFIPYSATNSLGTTNFFRQRRRPKGLKDKPERHHHALKALAIPEKKLHIVGNPELKIESTPVYLDVEGRRADRRAYSSSPRRASLDMNV